MAPDTQQQENSGRLPLYLTAGLIVALVAAYFLWPEFGQHLRDGWKVLKTGDHRLISDWVSQFGFWGPFYIVLFMVLQMFLLVINVVAILVVAELAYGPVWGSLVGLAGIIIASTIGYGIGRFWGKKAVNKFVGRKTAAKVEDKVQRYGLWAVIIARISPFLSNDAISFIAGTAGMGYWKFMAATLAGIMPLLVFIAVLGEDINRLKSGLIWVSVLSIAAFAAYYFYDRHQQKKAGKAGKSGRSES